MSEREPPTNCQQEPGYPGAATVLCSLRYPEMVAHLPTAACGIHEPHQWDECAEVAAARAPADRPTANRQEG